jgi:starvation-inducible DNA-binding protein
MAKDGINVGEYALSTNNMTKALGDITSNMGASLLRASLNDLLADTVDLYFRAHGFHWNVKGSDFAQYHELFGEIYEDLYGSIDPIAENILKIGFDAPFDIRAFAQLSDIPAGSAMSDMPGSMATDLYTGLDALIACLNRAFENATGANEQGIANFIADRIDMTKKWMWQLRSSIGG